MTGSLKYKKAFELGKPEHFPYDSFSIKHPPMDLTRRAKIFSPFDALKGFNEEIEYTKIDVEKSYLELETEPIEEFP